MSSDKTDPQLPIFDGDAEVEKPQTDVISGPPSEEEPAPGEAEPISTQSVGSTVEEDEIGPEEAPQTTVNEPAAAAQDPTEDGPALPPYFLTNRYNLLEIISSGLVKPVAGYPKYYRDLLAIAPGRIPILAAPAGEVLCEAVAQDDETAFPVALEFDSSMINLDGAVAEPTKKGITAAPDGVIPFTAVVSIHFRTHVELNEVRTRRFRNLEIPVDKLRVSPEFFGPSRRDAGKSFEWLGSLPKPAKTKDIMLLDRLAGSWAMAAAAAPPNEGYLNLVGGLIVGLNRAPKAKGNEPAWVAGGRLRTLRKDGRRNLTINDRVFEASVEALIDIDPNESWRPVEILDQVRGTVVPAVLDEDERSDLEEALDYVRAVLRNETDIRPFKPDRGLPAVKALLMVLLRPEPDRVLGWLESDVGPKSPEYVAAAALSGVLTGWSQLPVELRAAHVEATVTTRIAGEVNENARGPAWSGRTPKGKLATGVEVGPTGEAVFVTTADAEPVLERSYHLSLAELIPRLELRSDSPTLVELAEAAGWVDECVQTVVERRPLGRKKGQETTVFEGKPTFRHLVVPDELRQLVVERGLPPVSPHLRDNVLKDHIDELVGRT